MAQLFRVLLPDNQWVVVILNSRTVKSEIETSSLKIHASICNFFALVSFLYFHFTCQCRPFLGQECLFYYRTRMIAVIVLGLCSVNS
jgi:hypothetical protein